MKILIVEDDAVIGMLACEVLAMHVHETQGPAYSAHQALELARADPADIAFVDINLAGNDEGIALARQLRDEYLIPCIFSSGQVAAARKNCDAALALLRKPYGLEELEQSVNFIQALIAGKSPPPPSAPVSLEIF